MNFLNSNLKTQDAKLVVAFLDWFSVNARDLPWRRTRDPYAIWVSEIMLQQTQVKTVIPYWERWMRELPTIESLAKAMPAKIHKLWEGLGYYTRVRNMQKAAQQIVADDVRKRNHTDPPRHLGGYVRFPENFDDILALSGIGRYTAGAIASIAFNQPRPILDGNVIRVLTRIYGIKTVPREKKTNALLWQLAEEMVRHAASLDSSCSSRRKKAHSKIRNSQSLLTSAATIAGSCSALNQSLMELGALICTPRSPSCDVCPVNKLCIARKQNLQEQLPNLGKREAATARRFLAFIVERNGRFLVRQRSSDVVNAHLWEFPNVEVGARVCDPQQLLAEFNALRVTDPRSERFKPFTTIKHSITRYRITLEAWRAEFSHSRTPTNGQWRTLRQLHKLAFTSAHKKILLKIGA